VPGCGHLQVGKTDPAGGVAGVVGVDTAREGGVNGPERGRRLAAFGPPHKVFEGGVADPAPVDGVDDVALEERPHPVAGQYLVHSAPI
jgi:hypothetical protein